MLRDLNLTDFRIHQVRSYGRNIAVNVWWDHYGSQRANLDGCLDAFDEDLTLNNVDFQSFSQYMNQPDALRWDYMVMSWYGNIFRITGPLWGECNP